VSCAGTTEMRARDLYNLVMVDDRCPCPAPSAEGTADNRDSGECAGWQENRVDNDCNTPYTV